MKTVGGILKEARLSKKLTTEDVEVATKIRKRFLEAIEADDYSSLPSVAYAKGFVKNYSDFLGLQTNDVMAFFRRQNKEIPKSSLLPKIAQVGHEHSIFRLTPGRFLGLLLILLFMSFLSYFLFQYQRIKAPPHLAIESPADNLVTREPRIEVLGTTDPDATIYINGTSVLVRDDGRFFDQVSVQAGINKIMITATSRFGKTTTSTREVAVELQ